VKINNFTNINKTDNLTYHLKSLNTHKKRHNICLALEIHVLAWDKHKMWQD